MASNAYTGAAHKWRTNMLLLCIVLLAAYMMFFDSQGRGTARINNGVLTIQELEQELIGGSAVEHVTYRSPLDENIFKPWNVKANKVKKGEKRVGSSREGGDTKEGGSNKRSGAKMKSSKERAARYHRIWQRANELITDSYLWPADSPDVDVIVSALATARIVNVDVLHIGEYESGTAEKWIATLEGGQKAIIKIIWEEKGAMKRGALCNFGFEIPTSEIAAFHLHRVLRFNNTPYASGRQIDLFNEILPVASEAVAKQILVKRGNATCLKGTCFRCKVNHTMCPLEGIVEVSMVFWIPRKLKLYTIPPKYMPFSTPRINEWGAIEFNNRSYCRQLRKTIEPYGFSDYFYYDLFDFAVIDTLMYHYDSKHYTISDGSEADGLTVRLDHGRAFCAYDRDEEHVFLAPIKQCCTIRRSTYKNLMAVSTGGLLTKKLRSLMDKDPIAPVLEAAWYPALERRLVMIIRLLERCIAANGMTNVLVNDD